jgi:hypothetical protein
MRSASSFVFCCALALVGATVIGFSPAAGAQDVTDPRLPEAARLALRAKPGDVVKMVGNRKSSSHIHLEVLLTEVTTEYVVNDNTTFQYQGRGPNSTMQFAMQATGRGTISSSGGVASKPVSTHVAVTYTVKPNMDVVKRSAVTATAKSGGKTVKESTAEFGGFLGTIRLPDRALKTGDAWSGSFTSTGNDDLRGITLSYQSTLAGFEMYQSFPCARVETNYTYNGPMPAINAQIRKLLPKGATLSGGGQLTGTETALYALDRGWPMSDHFKLTVGLNFTVTTKDGAVEFGGTIEADSNNAVSGYPPYDASLVPKVVGMAAGR